MIFLETIIDLYVRIVSSNVQKSFLLHASSFTNPSPLKLSTILYLQPKNIKISAKFRTGQPNVCTKPIQTILLFLEGNLLQRY